MAGQSSSSSFFSSVPESVSIANRSDVVLVRPSNAINLDKATITLSFQSVDTNGVQGILSRDANGYSGDGNHLSVFLRNDTLYARFQDGDRTTTLEFGGVKAGTTYDIGLTFGNGTARLFVDGEMVDSGSSDLTWAKSPEPMQVGALGWGAKSGSFAYNNIFEGDISNLQIQKGILSKNAIAKISDQQPEPAPKPQPAPEPAPEPVVQKPAVVAEPAAATEGSGFALPGTVKISGNQDVVKIAPSDAINLDKATVALSFESADVKGIQGILSRDAMKSAGDGNHLSLYLRNDVLTALFQDGGNIKTLKFAGIKAGQEYDVALSFGNGTARLYVDGKMVDEGASGMNWETSPEPMLVGGLGWSSKSGAFAHTNTFEGTISNLQVQKGILSKNAIAELSDQQPEPAAPKTPAAEKPVEPAPAPVPQAEPTPASAADDASFALNRTLKIDERADVVTVKPGSAINLDKATIALSFKSDDVKGTQGLLSRDATGYSGDGNHLSLYLRGNTLFARLQDGDSSTQLRFDGIKAGKTYDVTLSFGNGEAELYVNGQSIGTRKTDLTWENSPEVMQIGALGWTSKTGDDASGNVFNGQISNVAIYEGIYSPAELSGDAPATKAAPAPKTVVSAEPEPVADPTPKAAPEPAAPKVVAYSKPAVEPEAAQDPYEVENGKITLLEGKAQVTAGRVSTLDTGEDDIASIRILKGPQHGNLTVNPDNTLALVLTDSGKTSDVSIRYEVTYGNGSTKAFTKSLDVKNGSQKSGWGDGEFYMLEEDADGNVVVEHGDVHRKVYISDSKDALSIQDIAKMAGVNTKTVTGEWLAKNPQFGGSENMALKPDIGMDLWNEITGQGKETSHWLLFERGFTYKEKDLGDIIDAASNGESELHPLYVGAWGNGDRPVLDAPLDMFRGDYNNIVVQGVELADAGLMVGTKNVIIDDATLSHNDKTLSAQEVESLTIRNTAIYDVYKEVSQNGKNWTDLDGDRIQGIFVRGTEHLLVEDIFVDHVGWEDGYNYNTKVDDGQAPTMFSQNIYLASTNSDVTLRDTISMRAAAYGAQVRSGGFVEDNAFIDNNSGVSVLGGDYLKAGPVGQYSLLLGNLVTSAGYRDTNLNNGALSEGIYNLGRETSLVDNIVTHLADPDSNELSYKYWVHDAVDNRSTTYYDDTSVYNWFGARFKDFAINPKSADRGLENADMKALDDTTIQKFAEDLLGRNKDTIEDLSNYLRAQHEGKVGGDLTADDIIRFFEDPFGLNDGPRTANTTLRFVPDDRGEGMRWDNELNWDTEDKPLDGDSIDLAGNRVQYDGTITLDDLSFGDGGVLDVTQGKLEVDGNLWSESAGGTLNVSKAGQAWVSDHSDDDLMDINVDGGRFANTGKFAGLFDILATDGQTILATDGAEMTVGKGSKLAVEGSEAKIGFDGDARKAAVLDMEGGTLSMTADSKGFATIEEFRSGAMGDDPKVLSGFDMGEGTLLLDVTKIKGASQELLVEVDEMVGMFDEINVVGLGKRDAQLIFDYVADTVTMKITTGGKGQVKIYTEGDSNDENVPDSLWDILTDGQDRYLEDDTTPEVNGKDLDEDDILVA